MLRAGKEDPPGHVDRGGSAHERGGPGMRAWTGMVLAGAAPLNFPAMSSLHAFAASLLLAAMLLSGPAMAQEHVPLAGCDCPTVRLDDAYCAASLVFEGTPRTTDTVMAAESGPRYPKNPIAHVAVRFTVERTLKGTASEHAVILTPDRSNNCMFRFIPGTRYLVFARTDGQQLVTDRCTPTRAMDTVGQAFLDSLEFVRAGNRWEAGEVVEMPCD